MKLNIDTEDKKAGWEYVGEVSVDSGRLIIADPCYFDNLQGSVSEMVDPIIETDILEICEKNGIDFSEVRNNENLLKKVASLTRRFGEGTFSNDGASFVATQTGYGDGRYPVYSKIEEFRVVGLWIDFECGEHTLDDKEEN